MTDSQNQNEKSDQSDVLTQTERMYFLVQHNLTHEAKNIIWPFLELAKGSYPTSLHKEEWEILLKNLQLVISDFENQYSDDTEMTLYGLHRNAHDLKKKEQISPPID